MNGFSKFYASYARIKSQITRGEFSSRRGGPALVKVVFDGRIEHPFNQFLNN